MKISISDRSNGSILKIAEMTKIAEMRVDSSGKVVGNEKRLPDGMLRLIADKMHGVFSFK